MVYFAKPWKSRLLQCRWFYFSNCHCWLWLLRDDGWSFKIGQCSVKKNTRNDNIRLAYNVRTEKVTVHVKNSHQLVIIGRLSIILGFGGEEVKIAKTTTSPYVADLNGTAMIYFFCDIIQPQVVGDTNAKLLKSVPVQGKTGEVVTKTFTNIQYVPVQTKSFEDIEITLRDDTGKPVPFERGKVLVTLHFKQQSSSYFV